MTTIAWIEASACNPRHQRLWDFMRDSVAELVAGRAEISFSGLAFASGGMRTVPGRLLNDAAVLQRAVAVAPETDAAIIGCWGAPTGAVRAALDIPVASVAEATVRAVPILARRAAMVTVAPGLVPIFAGDIAAMGGTGFLPQQPVFSYSPETSHDDLVEAIDAPGSVIDRFDAAALRAVDAGADAIVIGCAYLAALFRKHSYDAVREHPDVPVLDCNRLAIEQAFMLLELDRAGVHPTARGYGAPAGTAGEQFASALRQLG